MDFTFLPNKPSYRNKTFVRFNLRAQEIKAHAGYINNGFYYIGRNPENIDKLVKIYKRGYASENIENAKTELKRSLEQEKKCYPGSDLLRIPF